ncbi:hypothetical protein CROQUDRAFT_662529 [Cronartium quercuum f. sp. fusiforme G11]|uniref:Uncharacterized protein n=1 Tax=Cronartium quercuum f. sp. fusiforme G11 TaxID=708437 RepID=A0A9P6N9H2_9BASI|nr:hypothetical protein CROQUDRAFT_662529 [Cronartium quercuum f. sp. fusiforme G11]
MPRFTHKQALKRSIHLARTSRHETLAQQRKWLSLLAPLDVELAATQFIFRLLQILHLLRHSNTDDDRARARGFLMVALFEMAPGLDRSMELLLKGVRKLAEAYADLEVLEEALRIINRKRLSPLLLRYEPVFLFEDV